MQSVLYICAGILFTAGALASQEIRDGEYDVVIRNGTLLDGRGGAGYQADLGIRGDRIVAIGKLSDGDGKRIVDASGLTAAPGFIDMLGQSEWPLLIDSRSLS